LTVVQDQRDNQFVFGLAVARDMTRVCPYVGDKFGGSLEVCVGADTACVGGRNVDELTGGFAAEWAEEEGVRVEWGMIRRRVVTRMGEVGRMNVETFTDGSAT